MPLETSAIPLRFKIKKSSLLDSNPFCSLGTGFVFDGGDESVGFCSHWMTSINLSLARRQVCHHISQRGELM